MRRLLTLAVTAFAALTLVACDQGEAARKNAETGEEFLAENAKAEGIRTLPNGIQYRVIRSGPVSGLKPRKGDEVKVHYEGKLIDGKVFDSSFDRGAPTVMPLRALIPAWMEILPMMRPGDEWVLYVPPEEGYGKEGAGNSIPPNAVLIFRIQLIGVLPSGVNTLKG
jgi:FKBP-type peptidyl-prolyl cis-trans isomerase